MINERPLVLVTFQTEVDDDAYAIRKRWIDFIDYHGGSAVVLTPCGEIEDTLSILDRVDGVMMPGGDDINPSLYNAPTLNLEGNLQPMRDLVEPRIIERCEAADIPFLGICRGFQMLNVAHGGRLNQHVDGHRQKAPFCNPSHLVRIVDDGIFCEMFGTNGCIDVNSIHHQAVMSACMGRDINIEAFVPVEDIVEAVSVPSQHFCVGVQWHPEYALGSEFSKPVGDAFIKACEEYRTLRR